MKKKDFIKPSITVVSCDIENILVDASHTGSGSSDGKDTAPPKGDGENETITPGNGSDMNNSKNGSNFIWDEEW